MALSINPVSAVMGAEIMGVDAGALDEDTRFSIETAFLEHQIIVIRDQKLSPQAQVDFTQQFGPLELQNNADYTIPGNPYVLVISNDIQDGKPVGLIDAGDYWHSDSQSRATPSRATILHAIQNPHTGGDTLFANMYTAYDALSEAMKARLENLHGVNASSKLKNPRTKVSERRPDGQDFYASVLSKPDVLHPVVVRHPVTGRKALYVSPRFTIGIAELPDAEAQPLLDELFAHQLDHCFRYVHKWQDGDLVMWDNRCLMHCASGGYTYPDVRRMHRTVIAGDRPR